jgi:hypothetical protein
MKGGLISMFNIVWKGGKEGLSKEFSTAKDINAILQQQLQGYRKGIYAMALTTRTPLKTMI